MAKNNETGNRDDWLPWLAELAERRERGRAMGGPERVAKYLHGRGRLDARQRIETLFDPGSFREIGVLVGTQHDIPSDAFVCGFGKIRGRTALAGAEDFSVLGGSIGSGGTAKRYRIAELAMQERCPLVMMLDGAGHRLTDTGGGGGGGRAPNDLLALADLSGHVPMVCIVMGASAGHGALAAPLSDFTIMTSSASMFTGGPPLVKGATGEDVSKDELGGPKICSEIAGTAHNVADDDAGALEMARHYLSYFPQHAGDTLPRRADGDTAPRFVEDLIDIIPTNDRRPYDMHAVIERIVDAGTFFEVQPRYGRPLITGLAFIGGNAVGLVANNPAVAAGAVDSPAAIKAAEFLENLAHYRHPVVFLADNPGVLAGTKAEQSGILKWGGKMFRAERRLRGPKIHVTLRKSFGFGAVTMAMNPHDKQTLSFAFPGTTMGAMPAGAGGRSAKLDAEAQAAAESEQLAGPYRMADGLVYDDIIDPRELRNRIIDGLVLSESRRSRSE